MIYTISNKFIFGLVYRKYYLSNVLSIVTLTKDYSFYISDFEIINGKCNFFNDRKYEVFLNKRIEISMFSKFYLKDTNGELLELFSFGYLNPFVSSQRAGTLSERSIWKKKDVLNYLNENEDKIEIEEYKSIETRSRYVDTKR